MKYVTTMAQMWGLRPLKAKAFFGTPAGTETVHRTVSILRIALFESRSLQQNKYRGSPKSAAFWGEEEQRNERADDFYLSNKKVVTNDMKYVTTMAQMWGFEPQKPR